MATVRNQAKGKIYRTTEWRKRRASIIARTTTCEWCGRNFGGKVVPSIHHTVGEYTPSTGEGDEEAYRAMRDDEVAVLCKGCHYFWHEYKLKPGDPPLTCACGQWKEPQFETCLSCYQVLEATKSK